MSSAAGTGVLMGKGIRTFFLLEYDKKNANFFKKNKKVLFCKPKRCRRSFVESLLNHNNATRQVYFDVMIYFLLLANTVLI